MPECSVNVKQQVQIKLSARDVAREYKHENRKIRREARYVAVLRGYTLGRLMPECVAAMPAYFFQTRHPWLQSEETGGHH